MRIVPALILAAGIAGGTSSARADECDALVERVAAATAARVDDRRRDYASFTAGPNTTLTLACGAPDFSSVGAQFRGASPPDAYFDLFGRAGHAVTGIDAAAITEAGHRAQAASVRLRHSNVDLGGARITCSAMVSADKGPLTLCAVIARGERS